MFLGPAAALITVVLLAVTSATKPATRPNTSPTTRLIGTVLRMEVPRAERGTLFADGRTAFIVGGKRSMLYHRWGVSKAYWALVDTSNGHVQKRVEVVGPTIRGFTLAAGGRHVLLWGDHPGRLNPSDSPVPYFGVWDLSTGTEIRKFGNDASSAPEAAAIAHDGSRVLTAQHTKPLRLWDALTGEQLRVVETERYVQCLALTRDGRRAVLGGGWDDEAVYLWDLERNAEIRRFSGHHGVVTSVVLSPDESRILSASLDGTVRLWDVESGKELRRLKADGASVFCAALAPDGTRAVALMTSRLPYGQVYMQITPGNDVRVWDLLTAEPIAQLSTGKSGVINSVAFLGGATEVIGGGKNELWRWTLPVATSKPTAVVSLDEPLVPKTPDPQLFCLQAEDPVYHAGFLPNGEVYSCGDKNVVTRWDIKRGQRLGQHAPAKQLDYRHVRSISPDGRLAASLPYDSAAGVWELSSGLLVAQLAVEDAHVRSLAFSPDGTLLALGAVSHEAAKDRYDYRVEFFRTTDGSHAGTVRTHKSPPMLLAFAPDSETFVTLGQSYENVLSQYELDTAKLRREFVAPGLGSRHAHFSEDGSRVAGMGTSAFAIWDTRTGKLIARHPLAGNVHCVDLSPDGKRIITGGLDSNVRLVDAERGTQLAIFDHHRSRIEAVAFSADGKRAISGSYDRTLRVWRLPD